MRVFEDRREHVKPERGEYLTKIKPFSVMWSYTDRKSVLWSGEGFKSSRLGFFPKQMSWNVGLADVHITGRLILKSSILQQTLEITRRSRWLDLPLFTACLLNCQTSRFAPLQRVLQAVARFVDDLRPPDHVTATLTSVHWLPVQQRIT